MDTDYKLLQQIGGNCTTAVFSAIRRKDGHPVVLKMFHKSSMKSEMLSCQLCANGEKIYIPSEVGFLERLQHLDGCVKMYDFIDDTAHGRWILVLEDLDAEGYTNLAREIGNNESPMEETTVAWILREIITLLIKIHSCGILHCDLKPDNIFIDKKNHRVKLIDFNLAAEVHPCSTLTGPPGCTPDYAPPEVLIKRKPWTAAGEVWSIGCVAFVLLCHRFPFENPWMSGCSSPDYPQFTHDPEYSSCFTNQRKGVLYHSSNSIYGLKQKKSIKTCETKASSLSTKAKDFLLLCLSRCPEERPSVKSLLNHAFLACKGYSVRQLSTNALPQPRTIMVS